MVGSEFRVVIDTAETLPFTFLGIKSDANQNNELITVHTMRASLGRHPYSLGDYSIDCALGQVHVERKSREDIWGTILGWPTGYEQDREMAGRRERFESELNNLAKIDCSLVVVEATMGNCLANMPSWGKKSSETNAKIFFRSVLSYQQRWPTVQWQFCDDRRLAELTTYRWLNRFYLKHIKGLNREVRHRRNPRRNKRT